MAELLEDAVTMKVVCPACKKPLYSGRTGPHTFVVWCPRPECNEMADGPNEGGHGKSPEKALAVLLAKLGLSKDYVIENDEVLVENPNTGSFEAKPKVKGKRGRKAKETGPFTIPVGEFTMSEFCTANSTYPYKALPFFKEKGVEEVGQRKTSSGRGKPATLYAVKE